VSSFDRHDTTDPDHGRIEIRRRFVSHQVDWLAADRRCPGEPRFPGLKAIAMVEAVVENKRTGETTIARRCFLASLALDARLLAKAVRAHWGIENRLHWVLDVVFHDDLRRMRTEHGPKKWPPSRHMAVNLVKAAPGPNSIRLRRKAAGCDDNCRHQLLTGSPQ